MIAWRQERVCSCIPCPYASWRSAAILLGRIVGLALALEMVTATKRDAIRRRIVAAWWFAITSAAASTV